MTDFATFWLVYPKRQGSNPKALAQKKWETMVKAGADPYHIISSARKFADELRAMGKLNTEFVPYASTWLNQKRYLDYDLDIEGDRRKQDEIDAAMAKRGWRWNGQKWEQQRT